MKIDYESLTQTITKCTMEDRPSNETFKEWCFNRFCEQFYDVLVNTYIMLLKDAYGKKLPDDEYGPQSMQKSMLFNLKNVRYYRLHIMHVKQNCRKSNLIEDMKEDEPPEKLQEQFSQAMTDIYESLKNNGK